MGETTKTTGFLGQAALMLLPVLVLLGVGLHSLRQDRLTGRREATERAQRLAEAVVAESAAALTPPPDEPGMALPTFQVGGKGQLVFPPPNDPLRPRPLLASALPAAVADAWRAARTAEARQETAAAIAAYRSFLGLHPPDEFAANAAYALGVLLMRTGETAAAAEQFKQASAQAQAMTESGLPLGPLAQLKLLELSPRLADGDWDGAADVLCSNLVQRPSPLTPALLRRAWQSTPNPAAKRQVERWMRVWEKHERLRTLYAAAQPLLENVPRALWFAPDGEVTNQAAGQPGATAISPVDGAKYWLVVGCRDTSEGRWYGCWSEAEAAARVRAVIERATVAVDYFGVEVKVAGRGLGLVCATQAPGAVSPAPNAERQAAAARADHGHEWLRAEVLLCQPELLYAQQRSRAFWFGSLIVLAAGAALMGLWANWRAFRRQQRLSELKSSFVSSVSHELRTPVASVRALADGLESGRVSGAWKQQQYLRLITQECRRLSSLIDNILDFSRIEQGRKQFDFLPTDVRALAEQTVQIIGPYAAERHVSLALALPPAEPADARPAPVLDGRAIQQALLNLIDNAVKHSPPGQTVTVGLDWLPPGAPGGNGQEQTGGGVALWVEDRGAGIPPAEHERIFERFYSLGSELRRETQGVGIGLSIVKHTVESHGGRVRVRSAVGQGSRFTLELPARPPDAETAA